MDKTVQAALHVFGIMELPKTQEELKRLYRKNVKLAHPDRCGGDADARPFQRVFKANAILTEAIEKADVPNVYIKFGEGDPQKAKVSKRELVDETPSKYLVALHWFTGMCIKVENGDWKEVEVAESFVINSVRIIFVS